MNKRSFFKTIGGAMLAVAIEITGIKPRMPKWIINPEYVAASAAGAIGEFVVESKKVLENTVINGVPVAVEKYTSVKRPVYEPLDDSNRFKIHSTFNITESGTERVYQSRFNIVDGEYVEVPALILEELA